MQRRAFSRTHRSVTLASRLQLGPSALTPLVDKLEGAGFVTRARAADRRVILIVLTDAGRRLEDDVATAREAAVCRTGLADRELSELRQELRDLTDRIAALGVVAHDEPG